MSGHYTRIASTFRNWVSSDSNAPFSPQKGRYQLCISYACPWAHRVLLMLRLKGLEDIIEACVVDPILDELGWKFLEPFQPGNINYVSELYQRSNSGYDGKNTVPVLWDKKTKRIVNNESSDIMRILNSAFDQFTSVTADFYPQDLRSNIDTTNALVYENINNGVYKCGFAQSKIAYDEALYNLFTCLNSLESRLSKHNYLVGNALTEADLRLFPTLIRFDLAYGPVFHCNVKRIVEHPNLKRYIDRLYDIPEIGSTVNMDHIEQHFYESPRMKQIVDFRG